MINKYVYKDKKPIYATFIDFSKAFDSVWRQGLLKKLLDLGVGFKFFSIVKDMYSNTKFVFKKGNLLSYPVSFKCGDGFSPHEETGDKEWGYGRALTFSLSKHEETADKKWGYGRALTFSLSKHEETGDKEWGYGRALTFSLSKHEETADNE